MTPMVAFESCRSISRIKGENLAVSFTNTLNLPLILHAFGMGDIPPLI